LFSSLSESERSDDVVTPTVYIQCHMIAVLPSVTLCFTYAL